MLDLDSSLWTFQVDSCVKRYRLSQSCTIFRITEFPQLLHQSKSDVWQDWNNLLQVSKSFERKIVVETGPVTGDRFSCRLTWLEGVLHRTVDDVEPAAYLGFHSWIQLKLLSTCFLHNTLESKIYITILPLVLSSCERMSLIVRGKTINFKCINTKCSGKYLGLSEWICSQTRNAHRILVGTLFHEINYYLAN